MIWTHLQHPNFPHCNLLHHSIVFGLEELLDGNDLVRFLVSTFHDHAIRAFANKPQTFVVLHSVCSSNNTIFFGFGRGCRSAMHLSNEGILPWNKGFNEEGETFHHTLRWDPTSVGRTVPAGDNRVLAFCPQWCLLMSLNGRQLVWQFCFAQQLVDEYPIAIYKNRWSPQTRSMQGRRSPSQKLRYRTVTPLS